MKTSDTSLSKRVRLFLHKRKVIGWVRTLRGENIVEPITLSDQSIRLIYKDGLWHRDSEQ